MPMSLILEMTENEDRDYKTNKKMRTVIYLNVRLTYEWLKKNLKLLFSRRDWFARIRKKQSEKSIEIRNAEQRWDTIGQYCKLVSMAIYAAQSTAAVLSAKLARSRTRCSVAILYDTARYYYSRYL
jgi:hypothetical protein